MRRLAWGLPARLKCGGMMEMANLLDVLNDETKVADDYHISLAQLIQLSYKRGKEDSEYLPKTMTIKLRNPKKLGLSVVSWLRQDGLD